jgi:large subunit ribosomal protein L10
MNRDEKAAVIDEVAGQIRNADAIFAVDYRGISVKDAAELRTRLVEAGAVFRVIKNRLTIRAADAAGAETLKELLEGPTAFTFVNEGGDVALAAKALAQFRRQTNTLAFKGGRMGEDSLTIEQIESISRLPTRETLNGQFVGVLASPITTLVRGLASMISGLAIQLQQIQEQGLVGGSAEAPAAEAAAEVEPAGEAATDAEEEAAAEEAPTAEQAPGPASDEAPAVDAETEAGEAGEDASPSPQGDPVAEEAEAASEQETSEAPSEGDE